MDINKMLNGIACSCGKAHTCAIEYVYVEDNAMAHLTGILQNFNSILLVADENTYSAAGKSTEKYIGSKIKYRKIFSGKNVLIPNEIAINATMDALDGCDFILGIGSGVIQDLCKFVSHSSKIPYAIVATAPSMDGYASSGAAMITDGMKVTYPAGVPYAIVADVEVIKNAPMEMIKAGYGDIIGKYSALNDWKLSSIVNKEYFCEYIYDLTFGMLLKTLPLAKRLLERDAESIKVLMEALIVVGIAMSFAGNSRPASGSEHHLSHFFEITGIIDGTKYLPHGIDVLYSTYITSKIREKLLSQTFTKNKFIMNNDLYHKEMQRVYREISNGCIELQNKIGAYNRTEFNAYLKNEQVIEEILKEAPTSEKIKEIIFQIGLDLNELYETYSVEKIRDAIRYAKDLKDRYTVLWMYYDMYGLEEVL